MSIFATHFLILRNKYITFNNKFNLKQIMKKHFVLLAIALLTSILSMAESTFVDSGITYKITSDSTVNIIQSSEFGSRYQVLKDSVLVVPSTVEYKETTYRVICIEKYAFSLWQGFNSLVISDDVANGYL